MFNRQQKTVTTNMVQGLSSSSSSSSSGVTRTYVTTVYSTRNHCETSSNIDDVRQKIERCQLRIEPTHKESISPKMADSITVKKSSNNVPQSTVAKSETFQLECLNAHNEYRRRHGVEPLKLNPTLSQFAQNWANTIAKKRQLQHSSEKKYGENIYWSSGKAVDGKVPVDSWYDEITKYNYKNASFSSGTGHFTQVVWKNSIELGVGVACVGNEVYVVANYFPPGNYTGEFSKNVFPPK